MSSPTLVVFGSLSESRAAVVAMAVASWRASPTRSSLVADHTLPLEVSLEVSLNILSRDGENKDEEDGAIVLVQWRDGLAMYRRNCYREGVKGFGR